MKSLNNPGCSHSLPSGTKLKVEGLKFVKYGNIRAHFMQGENSITKIDYFCFHDILNGNLSMLMKCRYRAQNRTKENVECTLESKLNTDFARNKVPSMDGILINRSEEYAMEAFGHRW